MSRMIDADAFEGKMRLAIAMLKLTAKNLDIEDDAEVQMELKTYQDILNGVKEEPTIEERKTAHWIKIHWKAFKCSECGGTSEYFTDYCPDCGCRMMEVEHE